MDVSILVWAITVVAVIGVFVFDFYTHVRTPHAPTLRESATWSLVYIGLACLFGLMVWWVWGGTYGGEFFAGYVTEKALSVDNLFVFVVIFAKFSVPRELQQKALLLGIAIALVLRGIFIVLGSAAINAYAWVFYIFGAILLYTAINLMRESLGADKSDDDADPEGGRVMRIVGKVLPTTTEFHSDRLVTKIDGHRMATPLLGALVVIGVTDVLFALDSIPAIFGLTQEAYLVFTANALALMGLRQLFFLLDGLLDRLVYLSHGLSVILGFIAVKLVLHALHENTLPFINGGESVHVPEISTGLSLAVIAATLVVATVASLIKSRRGGGSGGAVPAAASGTAGPGDRPDATDPEDTADGEGSTAGKGSDAVPGADGDGTRGPGQ
ncbi:TerC family protein [Tomitella fengzijianii]|uniref:TerC family protein n=1 Tax=Tomitella fengzijianii TaxID=2597660 RepID=A0A516X4R4_9ACTN|nr:TerC family protein [Tomitella fengzijianii]QDQ97651.1 TerC family protein [Tomitella fengzijianii]